MRRNIVRCGWNAWRGLLAAVLFCFVAEARAQPLAWQLVTNHASWFPRDSCGEAVLNDRLWIFGGWRNSFEEGPRDVWSSADGAEWTLVTPKAEWEHGDLSTTLSFNGKMWNMGGWFAGRLTNASPSSGVWFSENGADWALATNAPWAPRLGAAGVVFKDRIWVLGGVKQYYYGSDADLLNDVWSSTNGVQWVLETPSAAWSPRAYHGAVVFDSKIWILGGGNYLPGYKVLNDVWQSQDGVTWHQVLSNAAWSPRIWFSAAVYRDRIWILGGWSNNPYNNWGDVWITRDGENWTEFHTTQSWAGRHEHSAYVFQDKLWVAGGFTSPLVNDVWSLEVPSGWLEKNLALTWNTTMGIRYTVESKAAISSEWSRIPNTLAAKASETSWPIPIEGAARFYRILRLDPLAGEPAIQARVTNY